MKSCVQCRKTQPCICSCPGMLVGAIVSGVHKRAVMPKAELWKLWFCLWERYLCMRFNTQVHELSLWPHHHADGLIRAVLPYPPTICGKHHLCHPLLQAWVPQLAWTLMWWGYFTAEAIPLLSWLGSYDVDLNLLGYVRSSFPESFSRMALPLSFNMKLHTVPEAQSAAIS